MSETCHDNDFGLLILLNSSVVISTLQSRDPANVPAVAYLYCDLTRQRSQTYISILACLSRQLAQYAIANRSYLAAAQVRDFHDEHKHHQPDHRDYEQLLRTICESLSDPFVILDAVDECSEFDNDGLSNRGNLIKTLTGLKAQVFITSRSYHSIADGFAAATRLEISTDPDNIRDYVHWRIHDQHFGSPHLARLVKRDDRLQLKITDTVVEKYSQM